MNILTDSRPYDSEPKRAEISPFMSNLLVALASELQGKADLTEYTVKTDCGFIRLAQEGIDQIVVGRLHVEEEMRGKGCGTALLQGLISVLGRMAQRTTTIKLWPVRTALGFYLRNGFSLYVSTSEESEYRTMMHKLYGPPGKAALAKIKIAVLEAANGEPWTHELLWPFFEKSGMPTDRPKFYSMWVADVAEDYEYAAITVQPSRGRLLAANV